MRKMVASEALKKAYINIEEQKITIDATQQWTHDTEGDYWYLVLNESRRSNDEIIIGDIFVSTLDGDITDYKNLCTLLSNGLYLDTTMEEGDIVLYCKINPTTLFTQAYNGFSVRLCHFYPSNL